MSGDGDAEGGEDHGVQVRGEEGPGGRLVVLTSRRPTLPLARTGGAVLHRITGLRAFGDTEVTGHLRERGMTSFAQRRYGLMQLVGARKPADRDHTRDFSR